MNFAKAAYARAVLRALAGEKLAAPSSFLGAVGSAAGTLGRGVNHVWQKSMQHNGKVMGTIGVPLAAGAMYAIGKHAINQTRASYNGFDPNVQAYTRQTPY